jgi:hypothetical protein
MVRSKMSGWSLRGKSLSQSILNYSFSIPSHLFFHSFVWGPCWLASGDLHPLICAFKYQFSSMRMSSTTSYINMYVLTNHRERLSLIGHVCGRLFLLVIWQVRLLGTPQDIHLIDQLEGCSCLIWQVHGPPCIWLINLNNCIAPSAMGHQYHQSCCHIIMKEAGRKMGYGQATHVEVNIFWINTSRGTWTRLPLWVYTPFSSVFQLSSIFQHAHSSSYLLSISWHHTLLPWWPCANAAVLSVNMCYINNLSIFTFRSIFNCSINQHSHTQHMLSCIFALINILLCFYMVLNLNLSALPMNQQLICMDSPRSNQTTQGHCHSAL